MHKIFGQKEKAKYADRQGVYLVPIQNGRIGVVQTDKGYFHPIQTYYTGELLERVQEPTEAGHRLGWIKCEDLKGKMVME